MSGSKPKHPMDLEERLKLASKLDADIDAFMESRPKREQPEFTPEYMEEILHHPFFMKDTPKDGEPMHPLYEGLQELKYNPLYNNENELAIAYKEDGNHYFKMRNYRVAIIAYTEGMKQNCGNPDIEAELYNNRCTAHFYLKNYRSCIRDGEQAIKRRPGYKKTLVKLAQAHFHCAQYPKSIEYCDLLLETEPELKDILDLRQKCIQTQKVHERDNRKREVAESRKKNEEALIVQKILNSGVKCEEKKNILKLEMLEPKFPQLADHRVYLNDKGNLVWPVVFVYPEYQIMDFVQRFCENDRFSEQLEQVFHERAEWDISGTYLPHNLNAYYENERRTGTIKVDTTKILSEILQEPEFVLRGGTPSFIIFVRGSQTEKNFLAKKN